MKKSKISFTDKRYKYWFLDNNIMLDASGELQIAYSLNNEEFKLQRCEKVLNHNKWKIINIPVTTTSATKEKILNFYDVVNREIEKYNGDILVVGKKDEMSMINLPDENKGYFGNITGSNKWYDKKNIAIIQTHNLSDIDYILKYLHYAKECIDEKFTLSAKCSGRTEKKIYSFTNPILEDIRIHWIASEIYQAIKRINRNMLYESDVLVFINNDKIIDLVKRQMKNCKVEVVNFSDDTFDFVKNRQDDYIKELKKKSYASKFISILAEIQNGLHQDMMSKVFLRARRCKIIKGNPFEDIDRAIFNKDYATKRKKSAAQRTISEEEMKRLNERFLYYHEKKPKYIPIYAVEMASMTGFRSGELAALRWDKIKDGQILVDESEKYNRVTKEYFIDKTKNRVDRKYPLTDEIQNLLKQIYKVEKKYGYLGCQPANYNSNLL